MTIDEQMTLIINELIEKYGLHYKAHRIEICELLSDRFGTNITSVIPSDYCYNRTNKGIEFLEKPRLLSFHGNGIYECLGENYLFSGPVYTREVGAANDVEVGFWRNGIFTENDNWNYYRLK